MDITVLRKFLKISWNAIVSSGYGGLVLSQSTEFMAEVFKVGDFLRD